MKKKIFLYSIIILCTFISACGKQAAQNANEEEKRQKPAAEKVQEPVAVQPEKGSIEIGFEDYSKQLTEEQALLIVSENVPVIEITGDTASSEKINLFFQKRHKKFQSSIEKNYSLAGQAYSDLTEDEKASFGPYSIGQTYQVLYQSDKILSVEETFSQWLGNNHPSSYVRTYVFDLRTGEKLTLKDIMSNEEEAKAFAANFIIQLSRDHYAPETFIEGYEDKVPDLIDDDSYYLNGDGLVIVCNQSLIAPYEAGRMEFVVPKEEFPLLKDEYKE